MFLLIGRVSDEMQQSTGSGESDWTDEYAISEESNFDGNTLSFEKLRNTLPFQKPGAQAGSILSSGLRVAQYSDDVRPPQDRETQDKETRQRMLKEELGDLQEALKHEKRINRGTEKVQDQARNELEGQNDGDWDFEFCVW